MKKFYLLLHIFIPSLSFAQWTASGTHIYNTNTGYVGIGTTNPLSKLTVQSSVASASTTYPLSIVSLAPDAESGSGVGMSFYLGGNSTEAQRGEHARITVKQTYYGVRPSFTISTTDYNSPYTAFVDRLSINPVGNVGIGTTTPDYRLTVNGKIKAEEIQVVVDVPADYVFEKDYSLMPLEEVEQFVTENKHLPGMPDAQSLIANGWQVGEMNNKLLEKVEELTLYMIQLKKTTDELQKQNDVLKTQIGKLEKK